MNKPLQVLVVEDQLIVAEDIRTTIHNFGYETCHVASNGEEAISAVKDHRPDLVLMDIRLDGKMDGIEAARIIHEKYDIPSVYITGNADDATLERISGFDGYGCIIKPFQERQLRATIQMALSKHEQEKRLKATEATLKKDQKQMELLFLELRKLSMVVRLTDSGVFLISKEGIIEWVNEGFNLISLYGFTEVVGKSLQVLMEGLGIHLDQVDRLQDAINNGNTLKSEFYCRNKAGSPFWMTFELQPIRDDDDELIGFISVQHDITLRKMLEEEMRLTNEQFKAVLDAFPGMVSWVSSDLRYLGCNRLLLQSLSHRTENLVGMPVGELTPEFGRFAERFFKSSQVQDSIEIPMPLGENFCNYLIIAQKYDNGNAAVFVGIDTSQRKLNELELMQSRNLRGLGQLAAGVSHEFNNLLMPMLMQISVIAELYPEDRVIQKNLEPVFVAINEARELTKRVLRFSMNSKEVKEPILLSEVTQNTVTILKHTVNKNISILTACQEDLPPLNWNRTDLHQVVMNLILNAQDTLIEKLSHDPPGNWAPEIRISIAEVPFDSLNEAIRAKASPHMRYQRLSVTDNGLGIPPDVQGRIFEPFFTTKGSRKSSGLGLSIVWQIVEAMGGGIEMTTKPGFGTTVSIVVPEESPRSLPSSSGAPSDSGLLKAQDGPPGPTKKLLLVEDDEFVARSFISYFELMGFSIHRASNGEEAWQIMQNAYADFDVLVTDLNMPVLTGNSLVKRIRSLPYKGVLVVLSGFIDRFVETELKKQKVDLIVSKPYSPEDLVKQIDRCLEEHTQNAAKGT
ncbi:MAG: response regulator [Verrucomicrobiae bacterium]|nr:response regulator [Verrucomicrobiae bacterium]